MVENLEPPEKWAHLRWHWIKTPSDIQPWEWRHSYWTTNDGGRVWPGIAKAYVYHGPCDPHAITLDPADEGLVKRVARALKDASLPFQRTNKMRHDGLIYEVCWMSADVISENTLHVAAAFRQYDKACDYQLKFAFELQTHAVIAEIMKGRGE